MQQTPRKGQRQLQPEDTRKRPQHGRDQIARDMGRGDSHDHGRDQTAREMSEDPKAAERGRK
ncbi:MAG: hypothetical protein AB7S71_17910 [Dongiaceae bacterium]